MDLPRNNLSLTSESSVASLISQYRKREKLDNWCVTSWPIFPLHVTEPRFLEVPSIRIYEITQGRSLIPLTALYENVGRCSTHQKKRKIVDICAIMWIWGSTKNLSVLQRIFLRSIAVFCRVVSFNALSQLCHQYGRAARKGGKGIAAAKIVALTCMRSSRCYFQWESALWEFCVL